GAIDSEDEQHAIAVIERIPDRREPELDLGLQVGLRTAAYAVRHVGDLAERCEPPVTRRAPQARCRVPGQRVEPGLHGCTALEPEQALPQVLARLGERIARV